MLFTSQLKAVRAGASEVQISSDWMQGRAAYGGLVAALVFEAMRCRITDGAPVRSMQITFVGPVSDEPLQVESEVLRKGNSVTHVVGRGLQGGNSQIVIQASFGHARNSVVAVDEPPRVFEKKPENCHKLPYTEGVVPVFTRHFDYRYATPFPFGNSDLNYIQGYVRYAQAEPEWDEALLLGLVDAWPPTTLPKLNAPAMASSLSWTVEFIQPLVHLAADSYCMYESHIVQSAGGYGHTRAKIWNSEGQLMAISQQTVTHFA